MPDRFSPSLRPPSRRRRLRQIAGALVRHGLGWLVLDLGLGRFVPFHHGMFRHAAREDPYTKPEHLRLALEDLGITAVKLGQVLSTRPDLIPPDLAAELARLQDDVPPIPFAAVRAVIEAELGRPLGDLYTHVEPEPLAAASIGQVHAATLADGTAVVVKVQRPGVEAQAEADLVLLGDLARAAAARTAWGRDYDVLGWVQEFAFTLRAEFDYTAEARHAEQIRHDFADEPALHVPTVVPARSSRRVLTLEQLDGIKVDHDAALDAAGVDRPALARTATRILLTMVLRNGFYHADPHAGNVLVLPGGRIGLLDFGMVGMLDAATREALLRIVLALSVADTDRLVDELMALGVAGKTAARGPLRQDLERLRRRYASRPLKDIAAAAAFHDIMDVARRHRLRLPAELVQLAKVTAMAEGTALRLDPDFDVLAFALPYVRRFWLRSLSSRAHARRLSGSFADLADLAESLPRQLRHLSRLLERGDLPLAVTADPSPETVRQLERATNRVAFSVLAAAFVVGSSLLALAYHPAGGHPAFVAVLILAVVLVLGLVAALWRRGRL